MPFEDLFLVSWSTSKSYRQSSWGSFPLTITHRMENDMLENESALKGSWRRTYIASMRLLLLGAAILTAIALSVGLDIGLTVGGSSGGG